MIKQGSYKPIVGATPDFWEIEMYNQYTDRVREIALKQGYHALRRKANGDWYLEYTLSLPPTDKPIPSSFCHIAELESFLTGRKWHTALAPNGG